MKTKNTLFVALSLVVALFAFSSCDKEEVISKDKLPVEISQYISTHFPNNDVMQAMIEKDDFKKTYEIILKGNIELKFNSKKEIIDIESLTALPESVIPVKIREYVAVNYPDNFIKGWELDDKNQQIELDNGLDLEFKMNGDLFNIES